MFDQLKRRWQVNGVDLVLIICTFAIGGSLCGFVAKKIMTFTSLEKGAWWLVSYILLMTLVWPLCVLVVSLPFGQFRFFKNYLNKIGNRMFGKKLVRVAVFASGAGSNAAKIIEASNGHNYKVELVVCNKPGAGVLDIAAAHQVKTLLIEKELFFRGDGYVAELQAHGIQFIVLAGFLWKVPPQLIAAYKGKILNIHPALLPKYGGKGMYGDKVHAAVISAGETESGITIHQVDEVYDHGEIVFQARCEVTPQDTPASLAQKIHLLEHRHYPEQLARFLKTAK